MLSPQNFWKFTFLKHVCTKRTFEMCKTPWSCFVLPERAEMKNCYMCYIVCWNITKSPDGRARVHTCPKWTVIGLRSSRNLGSLASTSGDGAVFGSCSSVVGTQPFSVMSCREKPGQGVGVRVMTPAMSTGAPSNPIAKRPARELPLGHSEPIPPPPPKDEGNGRLTWPFDF